MGTITRISFETAKEMLDAGVAVADVREENEFATGHVEGAVNLPLTLLIDVPKEEGEAFAEELFPDKAAPLMVYCRSGRRSVLAAEALQEFGYEDIRDMGGLSGWPYGTVND